MFFEVWQNLLDFHLLLENLVDQLVPIGQKKEMNT